MLYVVDDAADYRFLVQQVFKLFLPQHTIRLFEDGLELIQHVDQPLASPPPVPNLIIMDVDMPKLNGFLTLKQLKENAHWQNVPVVMMSNRLEADFVKTSCELGAVSYLNKPLNFNVMKDVMAQLCQTWLNN